MSDSMTTVDTGDAAAEALTDAEADVEEIEVLGKMITPQVHILECIIPPKKINIVNMK